MNIVYQYTRRQFYKRIGDELRVMVGQSRGHVAHKLSDLPMLPQNVLACLTPALAEGAEFKREAGWLWARPSSTRDWARVLPSLSPEAGHPGMFDGNRTVKEAGHLLSEQSGCAPEQAFHSVLKLFLRLVELQVAFPT